MISCLYKHHVIVHPLGVVVYFFRKIPCQCVDFVSVLYHVSMSIGLDVVPKTVTGSAEGRSSRDYHCCENINSIPLVCDFKWLGHDILGLMSGSPQTLEEKKKVDFKNSLCTLLKKPSFDLELFRREKRSLSHKYRIRNLH